LSLSKASRAAPSKISQVQSFWELFFDEQTPKLKFFSGFFADSGNGIVTFLNRFFDFWFESSRYPAKIAKRIESLRIDPQNRPNTSKR
jgi:hypothetical protein